MLTFRIVHWCLIGALGLAAIQGNPPSPGTGGPLSPRHRIGRDPVQHPVMVPARQGRPRLRRRVDWAKGLSHAERLLTLSQQVHAQIQAGPGQVPANLNAELKEIQKLTKQLRRELGY